MSLADAIDEPIPHDEESRWRLADILSRRDEYRKFMARTHRETVGPGEFYNHQHIVRLFMRDYRALFLKHEAGTGKTVSVILAVEALFRKRPYSGHCRKAYIVVPNTVLIQSWWNIIFRLSASASRAAKKHGLAKVGSFNPIVRNTALEERMRRRMFRKREARRRFKVLRKDAHAQDIGDESVDVDEGSDQSDDNDGSATGDDSDDDEQPSSSSSNSSDDSDSEDSEDEDSEDGDSEPDEQSSPTATDGTHPQRRAPHRSKSAHHGNRRRCMERYEVLTYGNFSSKIQRIILSSGGQMDEKDVLATHFRGCVFVFDEVQYLSGVDPHEREISDVSTAPEDGDIPVATSALVQLPDLQSLKWRTAEELHALILARQEALDEQQQQQQHQHHQNYHTPSSKPILATYDDETDLMNDDDTTIARRKQQQQHHQLKSGGAIRRDLETIYTYIWKVVHACLAQTKVLLLSATPMPNHVSQIIPSINLILPEDDQMVLADLKSEARLFHHFAGRFSFVSQPTSDVVEQDRPSVEMLTLVQTYMLLFCGASARRLVAHMEECPTDGSEFILHFPKNVIHSDTPDAVTTVMLRTLSPETGHVTFSMLTVPHDETMDVRYACPSRIVVGRDTGLEGVELVHNSRVRDGVVLRFTGQRKASLTAWVANFEPDTVIASKQPDVMVDSNKNVDTVTVRLPVVKETMGLAQTRAYMRARAKDDVGAFKGEQRQVSNGTWPRMVKRGNNHKIVPATIDEKDSGNHLIWGREAFRTHYQFAPRDGWNYKLRMEEEMGRGLLSRPDFAARASIQCLVSSLIMRFSYYDQTVFKDIDKRLKMHLPGVPGPLDPPEEVLKYIQSLPRDQRGCNYSFNELATGSGTITEVEYLCRLYGYEIYTGQTPGVRQVEILDADGNKVKQTEVILDKRPRVCVISPSLNQKETKDAIMNNIQDLYNCEANCFGEYCQVIFVTEAGESGISIYHVRHTHIKRRWTATGRYQAEKRSQRTDSHHHVIRNRPLDEHGQPLITYTYRHVAEPHPCALMLDKVSKEDSLIPYCGELHPPEIALEKLKCSRLRGVDHEITLDAILNDIDVRWMMRFMKRVSIDTHLNAARNMHLPGMKAGDLQCDYDKPYWDVLRPEDVGLTTTATKTATILPTDMEDHELKDITGMDVFRTVRAIRTFFNESGRSHILFQKLIAVLNVSRHLVVTALDWIMARRMPLRNRFGQVCYLAHHQDLFYLTFQENPLTYLYPGMHMPDIRQTESLNVMSQGVAYRNVRRQDVARYTQAFGECLTHYRRIKNSLAADISAGNDYLVNKFLEMQIGELLEKDAEERLIPVVEYALLQRYAPDMFPNSVIHENSDLITLILDRLYHRLIYIISDDGSGNSGGSGGCSDNSSRAIEIDDDDNDDDDVLDDDDCFATHPYDAVDWGRRTNRQFHVVHCLGLVLQSKQNIVNVFMNVKHPLRACFFSRGRSTLPSFSAVIEPNRSCFISKIKNKIERTMTPFWKRHLYAVRPFSSSDHFRIVSSLDTKSSDDSGAPSDLPTRRLSGAACSNSMFPTSMMYEVLYTLGIQSEQSSSTTSAAIHPICLIRDFLRTWSQTPIFSNERILYTRWNKFHHILFRHCGIVDARGVPLPSPVAEGRKRTAMLILSSDDLVVNVKKYLKNCTQRIDDFMPMAFTHISELEQFKKPLSENRSMLMHVLCLKQTKAFLTKALESSSSSSEQHRARIRNLIQSLPPRTDRIHHRDRLYEVFSSYLSSTHPGSTKHLISATMACTDFMKSIYFVYWRSWFNFLGNAELAIPIFRSETPRSRMLHCEFLQYVFDRNGLLFSSL